MLVTFHCDHCNAKLRINSNAMGSTLNCPECDSEIRVPRMTLGPGFVLGGFLIKHKIGQGGMGEVYLARQLSLERDVALKILPAQFTRQNSFVVRFLKEVHYQAKLDHPNIVAAYDAGEDNGVYFMAMAHVAGETLEDRLEREGPLTESDSLKLIRQVALALQYASDQKGILHRDIKPGNIIVTPALHAKVLDMGLSKNTLEKYSTTHADTLLGTPNYMSPEQIDHPQQIDTRSDMFSLGMTFYHLLTGCVPFEDSSYLKTLKRHSQEQLEDPRRLMTGISQASVHLLVRLTAREPEERFQSWDEVLEAVDRCLTGNGAPISLPPGQTTVHIDTELNPLPKAAPPAAASAPPPKPRGGRLQGILLSIAAGLLLGLMGIFLLIRLFPAPAPILTGPPGPAMPDPNEVENDPGPNLNELNRRFTDIILAHERAPGLHDETIRRLVELAADAGGTPIARNAAEQILRIRRARDQAVEDQRRRLRDNSLRLLQEQGAPAARDYLIGYEDPFQEELEGTLDHLLRQIDAWEQQENSQRESDLRIAAERYEELLRELAPLVLARDWSTALSFTDGAAAQPALFPMADKVALLRREVSALRRVPTEIMQTYRSLLQQDVSMHLLSGPRTYRLRDVRSDGLVVQIQLQSSDGIPVGSREEVIPFTQLSARELLKRMEALKESHHDVYRGLLAHQSGTPESARFFFEAADTDLARTLLRELAAPMIPFTPRLQLLPPP